MRLKIAVLYVFIGLNLGFSKNTDTLYVVKNHIITAKYSLQNQIDSLAFSQADGKYQLDLFKNAKKVKSHALNRHRQHCFLRSYHLCEEHQSRGNGFKSRSWL